MSAATLTHDALMPRPPGGLGAGAALALLVHGGLIAALTLSVDWRAQPPEVIAAELWAAVPQVAAPRAEPVPQPAPPPTPAPAPAPAPAPPPAAETARPPEPDIAIERERERQRQQERERAAERQRELERQRAERAEAERRRQAEAERQRAEREQAERRRAEAERRRQEQLARERAAEEQKLAQLREENLRRIMGQAGSATGAATSTGTAAQDAAPSAAYSGRLVALIRRNIVFPGQVAGNPAAEVEVRAAPGGSIIARRLLRSSGHPEWDEAVLRAIDRTGTLPRDTDGRVPPVLIITFRPND
ncbi:MAG: TonB C-terminal domain-containing protein [Rubrivivax sp.]|nr:TonB C-terminal domain-containing protein [Rubrivivax sp.]